MRPRERSERGEEREESLLAIHGATSKLRMDDRRLRAEAQSTSHLPPPHIILSDTRADTSPSADRLEVTLPPRKRLGIPLFPRYEVGESSSAPTARPLGGFRTDYGFVATIDREIMRDVERDVGYGITDTWDEMPVDMPGTPATDDTELGRRMTEFTTRVRQDTDENYTRLDDEQSERQLMAGRLNMLYRDRRSHARTARLIKAEAWIQRTTRSNIAPETTNTTSVTNAQLQAMINQGITAALAAHDAYRSTNGDDSHNSGTGVRRTEWAARECTYTDFLKCQPLNFKGTKGFAGLS
ncbi:hypothetical protein Tco_0360157 [Tanacetum coccineum]